MTTLWPDYTPPRTLHLRRGAATLLFHRRERRGCNHGIPGAGALSLGCLLSCPRPTKRCCHKVSWWIAAPTATQ
jgi:hypothetical protein